MTVSKFVNAFSEVFMLSALGMDADDGATTTDIAGCIEGFKDRISDIDFQHYYNIDLTDGLSVSLMCIVTIKFGRSYVQTRVFIDPGTYKLGSNGVFEVVVQHTKKQKAYVYKLTDNTIAYFYDLAVKDYVKNEIKIKNLVDYWMCNDLQREWTRHTEGNINIAIRERYSVNLQKWQQ